MTHSNRNQRSDAVTMAWRFTEQVPHGKDLDMQVISLNGTQVCMRLAPQPWMFTDDNTKELCTSVLYSLADSASGLAVFAEAKDLSPIATLDLRMDYLRVATGNCALLAIATCRHLTDEVAFILTTFVVDENDHSTCLEVIQNVWDGAEHSSVV